jgi:ABC-type microcin C transport system duplicated ATPase subunit YejF
VTTPLLQIEGLTVRTVEEARVLVSDVSFSVPRGAIVGLVGESGSGKSVTSLSVLRLLPPKQVRTAAGRIVFDGQDLLALDDEPMRALRGKRIAYVPQEPMGALNPTVRIGRQLARVLLVHEGLGPPAARARAAETLQQMHMRDPERILDAYPFQLSGGQRQRVLLANAFLCKPELLIADEPTTALDVTVQAQVLATLRERAEQVGASVLLVTHNMGVVWGLCSHTVVMRQGRVVEQGETRALFSAPQAAYTRALLDALPERATPRQPIQVAG